MKSTLFWILSLVITISAAIYQRSTGPTYPRRFMASVNDTVYSLSLSRSISLDRRSVIRLKIDDTTISAKLWYRRYPTNDDYISSDFAHRVVPVNSFIMKRIFGVESMNGYYAALPPQPEAGKLQYYIEITDKNGTSSYFKEDPVIVRFKGGVPGWIMIPHIILMFVAMLFSTLAGIMAIFREPSYRQYALLTLILLTLGGMILGPVVQYYAFGDLWTGVPFGWDLTDNKTLIAFIFWIIAVVMNRMKERPAYTILASVILLMIYSIPHSMFGSELDYESGKVIQGIIMNIFLI